MPQALGSARAVSLNHLNPNVSVLLQERDKNADLEAPHPSPRGAACLVALAAHPRQSVPAAERQTRDPGNASAHAGFTLGSCMTSR